MPFRPLGRAAIGTPGRFPRRLPRLTSAHELQVPARGEDAGAFVGGQVRALEQERRPATRAQPRTPRTEMTGAIRRIDHVITRSAGVAAGPTQAAPPGRLGSGSAGPSHCAHPLVRLGRSDRASAARKHVPDSTALLTSIHRFEWGGASGVVLRMTS